MLPFLFENFRLGLKNLRLHKLRSLLTALGIIFGVSAVIIMVAIGQGGKEDALRQMEMLGATNIVVRSIRPPESNDASARTQRVLDYGIKRADYNRLQTLPGIVMTVPMRNTEQPITVGATRFGSLSAIGTTPQAFEVINLRLERGQAFGEVHFEEAKAVAVIGSRAAEQMFPYVDPIGQQITVGTGSTGQLVLTVIGVLEPTGLRSTQQTAGIIERDIDLDIYFPLSLGQRIFGDSIRRFMAGSREMRNVELSEVWIKATDMKIVESVSGMAQNVMGMPARVDVQVKAPIEMLRAAERQERVFNFIMGGIASISLLVGGIGIMNIMLASVTERTREIGIRRALGAKQKHITLQFLIETTVISLAGGVMGIALGVAIATGLPHVVEYLTSGAARYPTAITLWSVLTSFAVSGLVGIGFGMYPALMAARMDPIEALRRE